MNRLLSHHQRVLAELDHLTLPHGEMCTYFRTIARNLKMDVKEVRRITRSLARKGFAEYVRCLIDEYDGTLAGSGYCITPAGRRAIEEAGRS